MGRLHPAHSKRLHINCDTECTVRCFGACEDVEGCSPYECCRSSRARTVGSARSSGLDTLAAPAKVPVKLWRSIIRCCAHRDAEAQATQQARTVSSAISKAGCQATLASMIATQTKQVRIMLHPSGPHRPACARLCSWLYLFHEATHDSSHHCAGSQPNVVHSSTLHTIVDARCMRRDVP